MRKHTKDVLPANNDLPGKVGERIKELRKKLGYKNQEHFAWDSGLSRSQYGKYEKGADMRISSLEKVLTALGVSAKEFFSDGFD